MDHLQHSGGDELGENISVSLSSLSSTSSIFTEGCLGSPSGEEGDGDSE